MSDYSHLYRRQTGKELLPYLRWGLIAALAAVLIAKGGILGGALLFGLPFGVALVIVSFQSPKLGLWLIFFYGFIISVVTRYFPIFPWGIGADVSLLGLLLIIFFKYFKTIDFIKVFSNHFVLLMSIWFIYMFLELFNPLAPNFQGWFFAMRGIGLYQFFIAVIGIVLLKNRHDFFVYTNIYFVMSLIAVVWGWKQLTFGVSSTEQAWLDAGEHRTHVLFGKLRVFSYYFDGGTFGSAMGQVCITALVLALGPFPKSWRAFYFITGLLGFYGMVISGTRGALAVPVLGGLAFLVMTRNVRLVVIAAFVLSFGYVFLRYTYIGQGNYQIARLRTAVDPNDASLLVRINNRARLTEYLKGKPFGGGIGSTGSFGQRFAPGTWLADFAPDGLYTRIRAEAGVIGKYLYLGIWLYLLARSLLLGIKLPEGENKYIVMSIVAGYAGVLATNYGNPIMTQFPVNLITFMGLAFIEVIFFWDEDGNLIPGSDIPVANLLDADGKDVDNNA